jgi:hypothetical protein
MQRMLKDCQKGKIKRIITKSVSRFARNTQELLTTLRMLKELGVSVYFEEQGIDTEKLNMELMVTFPGMAAQQESMVLSGNLRWSCKKRMESGTYLLSTPPYGFQIENGALVIDEEEAKVVKEIFNLYLQGVGKWEIAGLLNQRGITRGNPAKEWHHMTIDYILKNERYMGDALLQKSYTTDTLPFTRRKNKGEAQQYYVENSNVAIISREQFETVQKLRAKRKEQVVQIPKQLPLTGILKCPDCGRVYRRQTVRGIAYWLCAGKAVGKTICPNRRVREEAVYHTFQRMVEKLADHQELIIGTLVKQAEQMQIRAGSTEEQRCVIDKKIADLASKNHILAKLHTGGILSDTDYTAQSSTLQQKISDLRRERKRILTEEDGSEWLGMLRTLNEALIGYHFTESFDEELFCQIVDSITVNSNEKLTFHLIGDLQLTEKIDEKEQCKSS